MLLKCEGISYVVWELYTDFIKSTYWNIHIKQAHDLGMILKGFVVFGMKVWQISILYYFFHLEIDKRQNILTNLKNTKITKLSRKQ